MILFSVFETLDVNQELLKNFLMPLKKNYIKIMKILLNI